MAASSSSGIRDQSDKPTPGFRLVFVSLVAAAIGAAAAGLAYLIYHLIGFLYNFFFFPEQPYTGQFQEPWASPIFEGGAPWWIILIPALGGLIAGIMARYGSPKIIGHGIPEAMEAVWTNKSKIKLRILFLKPVSAAIAIGTGAPFGVEGPIIQGGGAMGSSFGQWLSTTAAERKVLLAAGAAAGMAATFNSPLAAILVAIELLVFEFRVRSFVPIAIASLIATACRHPLLGNEPMFHIAAEVPTAFFPNLPFLIVLGILIGLVAIVFKHGYFWAERLIHRVSPVNDILLPAVGGLILGIMALFVPRTFGVGYEVIEEILNNELAVGLVFVVMIFKLVGVTVTLGTKTSGGFLAPAFVAGAAVGSLFAYGVNWLFPGMDLPVTLFALAGLGTLFGVLCNATLGFTLFALEVTGQFEAILPVFLVAIVADTFTTLYMGKDLMTTELSDRGIDVSQDYEIDVLKRFTSGEVMDKSPLSVAPEMTVTELAAMIASKPEPTEAKTIHDGFPIVDADGVMRGIITYGDIVRAIARGEGEQTVMARGSTSLVLGHPDERLFDAVVRMAERGIEQLPIVDPDDETRLIGLLDSQDLMASALRQLDEDLIREEGLLSGLFKNWSKSSREP
jgi:H+/Cl- antiporter ClcA/CBS domain-containing protein